MRPIRTYLLIHSDQGWDTSVHRDFESLFDAWQPYSGKENFTGIIHVGLARPETDEFTQCVQKYTGRMIMTASARWALMDVCQCAPIVAGEAKNIPLYIAVKGWGYDITSEEIGLIDEKDPLDNIKELSKVNLILSQSVEDLNLPVRPINCLRAKGIRLIGDLIQCTEHDLQNLPNFGRQSMDYINTALAKFNLGPIRYCRAETKENSDIETFISINKVANDSVQDEHLHQANRSFDFVPSYLHPVSLGDIGLKVRTFGALNSVGLNTVGDIVNLTRDSFFTIPRFGTNSFINLSEQLRLAIELRQPVDEELTDDLLPFSNNISIQSRSQFRGLDELPSIILKACASLEPSLEKVVKARMGVDSGPMTLQEIGLAMGVTRERIRQREAKGMKQIARDSVWKSCLEIKLAKILDERDSPLPFSGLPILDSWFNGIEKMRSSFDYLLSNKYILNNQFALVQTNGLLFFSRISQVEWNSKLKQAMQLLEDSVTEKRRMSETRQKIDDLLITTGRELRSELWAAAKKFAHFSIDDDNEDPILLSYGRSAEALVKAILEDSERPLHYSELSPLIKERYGKDIDIRRANNAAADIALSYGKGSYGLIKHCPLDCQEREIVLNEVLDIISNASSSRQWSCDELVDQLNDRDLDFDERLNKYSLNIALTDSPEIKSVGRLIWTQSAASFADGLKRIDISQAVRALLEKAARPMSNAEIKTSLKKDRGVSRNFQIFPNEFIILISTGVWGLIDRDLTLSIDEQNQLRGAVEEILRNQKSGIHVSEISEYLKYVFEPASRIKDPVGIFAIAQRSKLISKSPGDYLYLSEWGEPRRKRKSQVVLEVLSEAGIDGITTNSLVKKVSEILGRDIPQETIYADINAAGAQFNQTTKHWILAKSDDDFSD